MDEPGEELLARPGLPDDHHRHVAPTGLDGLAVDLQQGPAAADDLAGLPQLLTEALQPSLRQLALGHGPSVDLRILDREVRKVREGDEEGQVGARECARLHPVVDVDQPFRLSRPAEWTTHDGANLEL